MHLVQVRHQFSLCCGASRRRARASAAVCSQEEIISTSTCARSTTPQELVFALLRHSQCLISQLMCQLGPRSRRRRCCCHETCFSSTHDLVGHFGRAAPRLLFFVSGRRASIPANLDNACSSSRNSHLMASSSLSGLTLPINSPPPSHASSP